MPSAICHLPSAACNRFRSAFSLIEVMVVVSLLSLIVLALMAVFSNTQRAFRAAVTQTDVMEGSRAAMDLMVTDLRGLTPSDGVSNLAPPNVLGPVNFFVVGNFSYSTAYQPLVQTLPGSTVSRTNLLNYFFVLGRNNTTWTGTGYIVDNTNTSNLYPLYRFYAETNTGNSPFTLYSLFINQIQQPQWTTNSNFFSHLMDGVVHLTVRAYDTNGTWINNLYQPYTNAMNTYMYAPANGEAQIYMVSNAVPASVELEVGVLEDRTLQHAESLPTQPLRNSYLLDKSGNVHLFRQRVTIPNVDPTAYQ